MAPEGFWSYHAPVFPVSGPGEEGSTGNQHEEEDIAGYEFGHSIPNQVVAELRDELTAASGRPVSQVLGEIDRRLDP